MFRQFLVVVVQHLAFLCFGKRIIQETSANIALRIFAKRLLTSLSRAFYCKAGHVAACICAFTDPSFIRNVAS